MKRETIPNFGSMAEESEFWDDQDATGYFDFDQPVKTKIDLPRKKMVTLRMEPELLVGIKELAARKKQRYQPMIREWIQERYLRENR